jgi:hypothetical protein
VVFIEAKANAAVPRNQSHVAAVADLHGGETLPRIIRWIDRAPWTGSLPGGDGGTGARG